MDALRWTAYAQSFSLIQTRVSVTLIITFCRNGLLLNSIIITRTIISSNKNISSLRHPDGASNPNLQSETCREPGNGAEESKDKKSQGSDEGDIEEVPYPPPLQSELLSLSRDGWVSRKTRDSEFFLHFSFRLYRLDSKTRVQSVLNGFTPYSSRLNHNYSLNTNNGKSHDPGGNNGNNPTINMLLYSRPTRCTLDLNVIKKKSQFNIHIHNIFRSPVEKRPQRLERR